MTMSSRRPAPPDRRQLDLFELLEQARAFGPDLKEALTADLAASPHSREQVAERMTALLDTTITHAQLDAWTAPTKTQHRFPTEYLPAFVRATGQLRALELLGQACGARVVVPERVEAELADVEAKERELSERRKELRALAAVVGGRR